MKKTNEYCNWKVREGTNNYYFAFTPCKRGFNCLTRSKDLSVIKIIYNNIECPICKKTVKLDTSLVEDT